MRLRDDASQGPLMKRNETLELKPPGERKLIRKIYAMKLPDPVIMGRLIRNYAKKHSMIDDAGHKLEMQFGFIMLHAEWLTMHSAACLQRHLELWAMRGT
jgi:hypothetical protein